MKRIVLPISLFLLLSCSTIIFLAIIVHHSKAAKATIINYQKSVKKTSPAITPKQPTIARVKPHYHHKMATNNDSIDITAEVLAMNNDKTLVLNSKPARGNIIKGRLENYFTKTDYGYLLNVHNQTPVSSPAIIGNNIYTSGGFGSTNYYSFNYETGKLAWADNLNDDGPSPAVYSDSALIINTESCTIFAINRFTGEMMWSHWLGDPLLSTPVVSGNKVYTCYPAMATPAGKQGHKKIIPSHPFVCFEANTGKILWQKWLDGDILVSPVVDADYLYLATFPGTVYKISKQTGSIIASVALKATSTPSVQDKRIYITHRCDDSLNVRESIVVLDKESLRFIKEFNPVKAPYLDYEVQKKSSLKYKASQLDAGNGFADGAPASSGWEKASENIGQSNVASLQLFQPSSVLVNNNSVICLMGKTIYCLDPDGETVLWKREIEGDLYKQGGSLATTPILASNYLVTVTYNGKLLVINASNGNLELEKNLGKKVSTTPVVKKGYVFIPSSTGELLAVNTHISNLDGWPMFMKNPEHNTR